MTSYLGALVGEKWLLKPPTPELLVWKIVPSLDLNMFSFEVGLLFPPIMPKPTP